MKSSRKRVRTRFCKRRLKHSSNNHHLLRPVYFIKEKRASRDTMLIKIIMTKIELMEVRRLEAFKSILFQI